MYIIGAQLIRAADRSIVDSTAWGGREPALRFPASFSDFHDFAYAYTVGS